MEITFQLLAADNCPNQLFTRIFPSNDYLKKANVMVWNERKMEKEGFGELVYEMLTLATFVIND